jgi:hypothetical protein
MIETPPQPSPEITVQAQRLSPEDERLDKLFDELESGSLKTLEEAARQIITLSTALLGAFFGLLSLSKPPEYLGFPEVKILGSATLIAFFLALLLALLAIAPRRYVFPRASLTVKRALLNEMLQRKHRWGRLASWLFGLGALLMLLAALDLLLLRPLG